MCSVMAVCTRAGEKILPESTNSCGGKKTITTMRENDVRGDRGCSAISANWVVGAITPVMPVRAVVPVRAE